MDRNRSIARVPRISWKRRPRSSKYSSWLQSRIRSRRPGPTSIGSHNHNWQAISNTSISLEPAWERSVVAHMVHRSLRQRPWDPMARRAMDITTTLIRNSEGQCWSTLDQPRHTEAIPMRHTTPHSCRISLRTHLRSRPPHIPTTAISIPPLHMVVTRPLAQANSELCLLSLPLRPRSVHFNWSKRSATPTSASARMDSRAAARTWLGRVTLRITLHTPGGSTWSLISSRRSPRTRHTTGQSTRSTTRSKAGCPEIAWFRLHNRRGA
jgi:hypothetical protein